MAVLFRTRESKVPACITPSRSVKTYSLCIPLLMPMADLRSSAQIGLRTSQLYRQILSMLARSMRDIPVYDHPIDQIEPETQISEAYRDAALRLVLVLEIAYDFVVQSDRPRMAMQQVGVALGLPSALKMSEIQLALLNQVTRQDFSKGVTKFLRIAQLPAPLALKSEAAKAAFRNCH